MKGLFETNFNLPNQTNFYRGKVRDVYEVDDRWLVMVVTDRISAFDTIFPEPIPYKGQVLNQISAFFLDLAKEIVPVWLTGVPHPNVSVGVKCDPIPVEFVVRAYLAGSALRKYIKGERIFGEHVLPDGLKPYDPLPEPILTPTTKSHDGHDVDISPEEIIKKGILSEEEFRRIEAVALKLFEQGSQWAQSRNLILADTKYEFGYYNSVLFLIDEVHTPDSSRYFDRQDYELKKQQKETPEQLSKEKFRQWLLKHNFSGEGPPPQLPQNLIEDLSKHYIEIYEKLIGNKFIPHHYSDNFLEDLKKKTVSFLEEVGAI
ncbi:MAG: phosphoribosylaminoimidazolesuccinocarboxamide synthase [Chlorobi bacterium]|nr:phosphoribosylaminoimidazolesuccinocarboxamide synthase [Chlorobiota bacterium]